MLYDIIVLEPSTMVYVSTWLCDCYCDHMTILWQYNHDITLILNLDLRVKKKKKKIK